jgi:hypothetical protein
LAQIWQLSDVDDRGKLNIAEFHTAMGLIYRRESCLRNKYPVTKRRIRSQRQPHSKRAPAGTQAPIYRRVCRLPQGPAAEGELYPQPHRCQRAPTSWTGRVWL